MKTYVRTLAHLEGISFLLLLFLAMPLKYLSGQPEAVRMLGPIHGILFLVYCFAATSLAYDANWPRQKTWLAYAAAVLPFGPFVFDKKLFSR